ncbi:MAG: two-component system response regulator [Deltaproteobacteria bacterium HGW-Deltaproteobacteria-15]|nr:MAG: two-component system response regulator [Deltaproteobacteria bacterium HGW-Deltaproteobacteria-15]
MRTRVLMVDDEKEFVEPLAERLALRDYDVTTSLSGEEAIEKIKAARFDVVVLDVSMPGMDGIDTLREIKRLRPILEVILLTGHATVDSAIDGLKLGAFDYLKKPCETEDLIVKIEQAYKVKADREERIREARIKEIIQSPRSVLRRKPAGDGFLDD